jgi:Reverse transcriptase (RNA-dependent DNA polymerase)
MELDAKNRNTKWRDAELVQLAQINEYKTFSDRGKWYYPGADYKRINVHFVYAAKPDWLKARLVAGGHLTDTPVDSVYSSAVSLRGIQLVAFLAELNGLKTWSIDVGNAYLESFTKEKVYIIAGPESGDGQGHTLVIVKALYSLKSSGLRWGERFANVLKEMGFSSSWAEPDIWMREKGDHYEYIAVYVDDKELVLPFPEEEIVTKQGTAIPKGDTTSGEEDPPG